MRYDGAGIIPQADGGLMGVICSTTRTAAAKSSGSQDTKARSASTPPADAATATAAGGRAVG